MDRVSAAPPGRVCPKDAGFTLLEMVIVVTVLAVLSVSVGLSVGRIADRGAGDAARFAAQFERMRHLAIIGRSIRAMALSPEGWQMLARDEGAATDSLAGWQAQGRMNRFSGEVRIATAAAAAAARPAAPAGRTRPDILFLPDGQATPLAIAFISAGAITRCATDGWATLACNTR